MKKFFILTLIVLITFHISGCNEKENIKMQNKLIHNIPIINDMDIKSIKWSEYKLLELKDFFGEYSSQEKSVFALENSCKNLEIQTVNNYFPIKFIRENEGCYYSIYKVSEGGFYYVFWFVNDDNIIVSDTFYINKLKKKIDFDSLKIGKSTAEDVSFIDPAFELIFLMSSKTPSYSLLDDGNVMEICYKCDGELNSRKDLIVKSKKIIPKEKCPSYLASINSKDLP